ncbi:cysteine synthase A [Pseudoramibacter sp.]|uniref:cysteine synthase A n=1 Tax=Pseudoramibacter sp. TaxID=2034862 RepID=UPI0025F70673|nr:cysteine synthase A [Pseudoramibacter sp.]MCH4073186.1 cysteine synthase A [Pseudoramibacter sp.]MCH4106958.1 cysteine synthase A [Pseudoramibacter sp.]
MIYQNILEAVGHTPLVQLNHMTAPEDARILVKVEALGVGGSIKTRTALRMIEGAEKRGDLKPGSVIVEPTSGNQGIGLAMVGAVKGYDVVIIMPDSVSEERRKLIRQYGAKLILEHDDGDIGACIARCIERAKAMVAEDSRCYMPNQFANVDNRRAHYEGTGREIAEQADGPIDAFCSGFGTGGTITGIGKALRKVYPDVLICAAEPEHAALLSGGKIGSHLQMGIGDGVMPPILDKSLIDEIEIVTDEQAIATSRKLARKEGLLCGISSGTNVFVAQKLAKRLGKGKTVVTVLPDTGERYFSTPLFED